VHGGSAFAQHDKAIPARQVHPEPCVVVVNLQPKKANKACWCRSSERLCVAEACNVEIVATVCGLCLCGNKVSWTGLAHMPYVQANCKPAPLTTRDGN